MIFNWETQSSMLKTPNSIILQSAQFAEMILLIRFVTSVFFLIGVITALKNVIVDQMHSKKLDILGNLIKKSIWKKKYFRNA